MKTAGDSSSDQEKRVVLLVTCGRNAIAGAWDPIQCVFQSSVFAASK